MRIVVKKSSSLDNFDGVVKRKPIIKRIAMPKTVVKPVADKSDHKKMMLDEISKRNNEMINVIKSLVTEVKSISIESVKPVTDWDFEIIRDETGRLMNVRAHGTAAT